MSNNVNKVIIVGRLTRDPEGRDVNGTALSSFSVATSQSWKDKNGEKQERTEFVNCTAWGKLAEICNQYLQKGKLIYLEGRLQTDKYEKDGQVRYATKVIVNDMKMLSSKSEDSKPSNSQPSTPAPTTGMLTPTQPVKSNNASDDIDVNDIPF